MSGTMGRSCKKTTRRMLTAEPYAQGLTYSRKLLAHLLALIIHLLFCSVYFCPLRSSLARSLTRLWKKSNLNTLLLPTVLRLHPDQPHVYLRSHVVSLLHGEEAAGRAACTRPSAAERVFLLRIMPRPRACACAC